MQASAQLQNIANCSISFANTINFALPISGFFVPNSSRLKLYTAIAVYVIIEKRCRNNANNITQNDCPMLLPQIILYTPTFSLQSFTKNNMPSWLHLCFIHWVSVGDVHCRIVKTITIKCRTVWLSRVQLITYTDSHRAHPLPWYFLQVIKWYVIENVPALCQTTVHWLVHACSSHWLLKTVIFSIEHDLRRILSIISDSRAFPPPVEYISPLPFVYSWKTNSAASGLACNYFLFLVSWAQTSIWVPLMNFSFHQLLLWDHWENNHL